MKIIIIGGVAGGASAATRLRRMNETNEIIMFERSDYISFANCGLPYFIGNEITDREFERDMRSAAIEICSRIAFATGMSSADVDTILWNLSQDLIASGAMSVPAMRVVTRSY